MHTAHCTHKGCARKFTKPTKSRAEQAVQMHVGRTHDKSILNGRDHMLLVKNPTHPVGTYQNGTRAAVATESPPVKVDRRTREWRAANVHLAKPIVNGKHRRKKSKQLHEPVEMKVNYCPQCGCNMQRVAMGLVLAERM